MENRREQHHKSQQHTNSYAKLTINGEVLYEVDVINMIEIVDGEMIMSEQLTEKTVQLDTPIKRGKTEIAEIVLRKPQSGALRGTRLQAIMDMDVGAMMTIIPRISTPALTLSGNG
ncbi:hypothetical protein L1887_46630 [Cichorium endivia]|nr:hypothetical protein L1887_46630 [Cichorium endivia]